MSRKTTTTTREKRRLLNKAKRRRKDLEHLQTFGIPRSLATPSNMMKVANQKKRKAEFKSKYKEIIRQAKLFSISQEDFEYCGIAAKTQEDLSSFRVELEERLAKLIGKSNSDNALDTCSSDYLQEVVDAKRFGPIEIQIGSLPKARKFSCGKIKVMREGEPDYDFLVEKLRVKARKG